MPAPSFLSNEAGPSISFVRPTARSRPSLAPDDDAIRGTDDDAASSRLSAMTLGYLDDPFVPLLSRSAPTLAGSVRKPPLINVGTHHRTWAIDRLVDDFVDKGGRQIVSLGAGSDTRFFRLMAGNCPPNLGHYVEVDFPMVTAQKARRIYQTPRLHRYCSEDSCNPLKLHQTPVLDVQDALTNSNRGISSSSSPAVPNSAFSDPAHSPDNPTSISKGGTRLSSTLYTLLPLDLRSNPAATLATDLLPILDTSLPTLFLAECVFCYMPPETSQSIIGFFGESFAQVVGVVYEMCGLDDTFGRMMKRNLASRSLSLPGATFASPSAQAERFLSPALGPGIFDSADSISLWDVREEVIGRPELNRIAKLEFLDEIEELRLVLSHYCVAWGMKGMRVGMLG